MKRLYILGLATLLIACQNSSNPTPTSSQAEQAEGFEMDRTEIYSYFELNADLSSLSDEDKQIIPLLIQAASVMNRCFWYEAYGDKDELISSIENEDLKRFADINYGPWDRLNGNASFLAAVDEKPLGANFYPADMTKDEFDAWNSSVKNSQYTFVRRDESGKLSTVWYRDQFAAEVKEAAGYLRQASELTTNYSLKYYLELRAEALETDRYNPSDVAWLKLEDNDIDIIIGPIETYEDQLFGYKAAHEAYVLVKDREWSDRLARYKDLLPRLQTDLPCADAYKQDEIGGNAQLSAYDVIFYAGDCNSGSKTIAVNLPNDEGIQQDHGTRRSQLKNAMRAKYDEILIPISEVLIEESQREHITFNAFFGNTMFHEVAHGLGIKNTIDGNGTVRDALKEETSALEEGKADVLGLWMVTKLYEWDEIEDGELMDNYVTFLAGIFRSVRFGASSAHGRANMLRFNYFQEHGAFVKDPETGFYSVDMENMEAAVTSLSGLILQMQGDGAYNEVKALMEAKGIIGEDLASDLDRINEAGIPVDVVFEQGVEVLGL